MAGRGKKKACKTMRLAMKGEAAKQEAAKEEAPLRPSQCRAYMRRTLAHEFREIVQGFVESAKQGSCQHVKLVTELMTVPKRKQLRGRGKVEAILRKLDREEAEKRQRTSSSGEMGKSEKRGGLC